MRGNHKKKLINKWILFPKQLQGKGRGRMLILFVGERKGVVGYSTNKTRSNGRRIETSRLSAPYHRRELISFSDACAALSRVFFLRLFVDNTDIHFIILKREGDFLRKILRRLVLIG
jgi:hypothetical protein